MLYFVFFAAATLLLGATSWVALRHSLRSTAQHELEERADDVQAFLNHEPSALTRQQVRDDLVAEYGTKDEGKYLAVLDDENYVLYFSERRSLAQQLGSLPESTKATVPFHEPNGGLQAFTRPMFVHGKNYRVATAIATKKSNALLRSFLNSLLILTPALLMLAALAGHIISRRALSPVAEITAAARDINDRNLSVRLPTLNTRDELSSLSGTLNQMLGRIDTAFSSVRALTANASHELRTPIALIRTRVEIALCFPRTAAQYQDVLSEVQASAEHMTEMLESLLRLARADAAADPMQWEAVELTSLLDRVGGEWHDTANLMKLNFITHMCESPIWIRGEATALHRLLHILIDNAFRHTPEEGTVDLRLETLQGTAILSVSDSGTGIAAEDLPHIFERFYRANPSGNTSRTRGGRTGAGLGLSLAKWIAEQHATQLTVESEPDRGSRFEIVFPIDIGNEFTAPALTAAGAFRGDVCH